MVKKIKPLKGKKARKSKLGGGVGDLGKRGAWGSERDRGHTRTNRSSALLAQRIFQGIEADDIIVQGRELVGRRDIALGPLPQPQLGQEDDPP